MGTFRYYFSIWCLGHEYATTPVTFSVPSQSGMHHPNTYGMAISIRWATTFPNLNPPIGVGSAVVGPAVVGSAVVGSAVVGSAVVGSAVVGSAVVGSTVVGSAVVGSAVVGSAVVGSGAVGTGVAE